MAKKNKKSEKLNLSEFLGPEYTRALPSAPSARDASQDSFNNRRGERRGLDDPAPVDGWRRGGAPSGGPGGFEERRNRHDDSGNTPISRADEDGEWRKSRPQSARSDAPRSVADEATEWRSKLPERPTPPPSAADEATQWRRREPLRSEGQSSRPPSAADEASEWRSGKPPRTDSVSPNVSEDVSNWRRTPRTDAPAVSTPAETDNNWRKAQPLKPVAEESTTPKPSETDDWRANKVQLQPVEPPKANRAANDADTVDNWRTASKLKKPNTASKRKRDVIPVDSEVLTIKGKAVLVEDRPADNVRVVKLENGEKVTLKTEEVIAQFPKDITTPYGKGEYINYRFEDGICEVALEFGARAFLRASELNQQQSSTNNKSENNKSGRGSSNNKRGNKHADNNGPPRGRRFGDLERDRERENAFAGMSRSERRGGKDTPEESGEGRSSKAELFAPFSTNRDKKPAVTPPPAVSDTVTPPPPRAANREEKDKLFAAFNSGGKRERGIEAPPSAFSSSRSSQPPPQAQTQRDPALFAAFERMGSRDRDRDSRERPSFPGFGNREDRQGGGRESFPGFGGDRRERRSEGSSRLGGGEEKYLGGIERINANRNVPRVSTDNQPPQVAMDNSEEFPSLAGPPRIASESPAPVDVIAKTLPKGSKWGEDDDEDIPVTKALSKKESAASTAAPKKLVSVEMALNTLRNIVKEYMVEENKSAAINAMSKIPTENDSEVHATFVASLSARAFETTKDKKLVAGLLVEMVKGGSLAPEAVAEGLTRTLETNSGNAEKLAVLKDIFESVLEKAPALKDTALRGEGAKLRDSTKTSTESGGKNVDDLAADVFAAGAAGLDKMKALDFAKVPGAGLALLRVVLKDAKLDEPACGWVSKNAKVLGAVLYEAPEPEQLKAIEAIQVAFNEIGFPKTSSGPVIDKAFTQLYNHDVLPDSAFIAWKDDLSLNAPGRDKAIIQTTSFFQALEAEEYEDEEDEE